ncbi:metallophosphoesterase [Corynebacterium heidelbergense]|uniref:Uncharacterized protein n=1 Tax=Corynebacterium heidelbergense TaxID=2055947 RepID=A0A364VE55_9CORY|nr:metallophosphoesterase [Corynebacterium heidelbergense]RAV34901.1 hypothetical protein CWC39_00750 [Corynebacterium heidelbergense]WCZ36036.1 hypothetical protein CHEID_02345 [Corynebacterium heidelbergense]
MNNLDALRALTTPPEWRAGCDVTDTGGHVTTPAYSDGEEPDWQHVLEAMDLDPDRWQVDGAVRHSAWEVPGHGTKHAYRARIVPRIPRSFDVEDLIDSIYEDIEPPSEHRAGWRTLQIGDTHIGKGEGDGGGTEKIMERWRASVTAALDGAWEGVHLAFLGDLIEGQVSQNGKNIAGMDCTLTEQLRIARHLVSWTVQEALHAGQRVIVSAIPGNHGETTRVQGRPLTDSFDVDIVNAVQQSFDEFGNYPVTWYYPRPHEGHVTYEVGDTTFTSVHGHYFSGKMTGAEKWWSGMAVHGRAPGRAQVMMCGHFHSMQVSNFTADKWIMFGPSLETQSTWFAEKSGASSKPGILAYDTINGVPTNIGVV